MAGKRKTLEHTCAFLRPVAFHFWKNCSYDNLITVQNLCQMPTNALALMSNGEVPKFHLEFLIIPG